MTRTELIRLYEALLDFKREHNALNIDDYNKVTDVSKLVSSEYIKKEKSEKN